MDSLMALAIIGSVAVTTALFFLAVLITVRAAIDELRDEADRYRRERLDQMEAQLSEHERKLQLAEDGRTRRLYDGGGW